MRILTVGSKDPGAGDMARLIAAAEDLGEAIIKANHSVLVVSDRDDAIDQHVVAGARRAKPGTNSIEIHRPTEARTERLTGGSPENDPAILVKPYHQATDLSVIHLNAMADADAVILLGGGRGTIQAGLTAHLIGKPVVPIGTFGGGAQTVWSQFSTDRKRFYFGSMSDLQIDGLQSVWRGAASATEAVDAARRIEIGSKRRATPAGLLQVTLIFLLVGLVGWVAFLTLPLFPGSWMTTGEKGELNILLLFVIVLFTGVLGASVKVLRQLQKNEQPTHGTLWIDVALGIAAGVISAVLYLVAEAAITGKVDGQKQQADFVRVGLVLSLISVFAGLYLDAAFERFDAMKSKVLAGDFGAKG